MQEPTAIKDPKTGDLVVANEEIKKVTFAYCGDNLSKKSQGRRAQLRNTLNEIRMEEHDDERLVIEQSDF